MGRLIYLMGKSCSGKDTIYRELLNTPEFKLKKVVLYTTRPIRAKEQDGVQYHFVDDDKFNELKSLGHVIEDRAYETFHGVWRYFTVDDGSIDLDNHNYLIIGTLESFLKTAEYYGRNKVLPVYLEIDDGIRLQRALNRELKQEAPKYEEMCRRFLADSEDFSEEHLKEADISVRFKNEDLMKCLSQVKEYINEYI